MIPAREVAQRSGTNCIVDGPVERERCLTLFTHPAMKKVFAQWNAQRN